VAEFLYLLEPTRADMVTEPTDDERLAVQEHYNRLARMLDEGRLILAGRTLDTRSVLGIVAFEAESEESARRIMEDDPAVAKGVMRATLHPFRVALLRGRPR
jgi:uncharacterized protein YciI